MPSSQRFYLPEIFGDTVQIRILDTLCNLELKSSNSNTSEWLNLSHLATRAKVAKSSAKRIVDELLQKEFVKEKKIQTHAQNPPREIKINQINPVVKEILFFYRKIRGFL